MTDKQKAYIEYLDDKCRRLGIKRHSTDEDLLGKDWKPVYKNFTPTYTEEVIIELHKVLGIPTKPLPKRRKRE